LDQALKIKEKTFDFSTKKIGTISLLVANDCPRDGKKNYFEKQAKSPSIYEKANKYQGANSKKRGLQYFGCNENVDLPLGIES
jgi:hypothetical protein